MFKEHAQYVSYLMLTNQSKKLPGATCAVFIFANHVSKIGHEELKHSLKKEY